MTVSTLAFLAAQTPLLSPVPPQPAALAVVFFLFGFSGAFSLLTLAQVRELFPPYMGGRAVTAVNLFGFGGATVIQWGMGVIISAFAKNDDGRYSVEAYIAAFGVALLLNALALVWYLTPVSPGAEKRASAGGVEG